ncbi:alpha/beta fold hydrolase [Nitratireductor kimnyeongensis]|uniref:Alpha/beta fold hydrolase n=1 Tax=Nitratireductor kimnyeongensis TaxID=430679 RepID=A0ABW0T6P9_9HYPH|nr:alpha/beta hydrolase [Nitratireductor kimnyeongensis]QZZ34085.1 alpha/beta hydrolase [Nitratireductor kimnyeongensis]
MKSLRTASKFAIVVLGLVFASPVLADTPKVLLVPGIGMEGASWRAVFEKLTAKGIETKVLQLPFTSMPDDVKAARRAIRQEDGPMVLVGHSYGGMIITQAAQEPAARALVYIAAFQPEVGDSLASLNATMPPAMSADPLTISEDGYFTVKDAVWMKDVANGLSPADATYTANAQAAANIAIFTQTAQFAAWHGLPVWSAVATRDRTVSPDLQRWMSERSGAQTIEIAAGHLLPMSHPNDIAELIERAVASVR